MNSYLYNADTVLRFNPATGRTTDLRLRRLENIDPVGDGDNLAPYWSEHGKHSNIEATVDRYCGTVPGLPFVWHSHDGGSYDVADMATPHLFYALRMVWNHSVPEIWRVGDYKRYRDVPQWSAAYRKAAIDALATELVAREDMLSEDLRQQFFEIVLKTAAILALGI